jgi:hypothetical protein
MSERLREKQGWIRATFIAAALTLALPLIVVAAGCGTSPLTPGAPGEVAAASGPEVLKVNADGTTSFVPMPNALYAPTPLPYSQELVFDPTRRLSVSTEIDGAVGGRLICGPYVLTFPAGAFDGTGTVTMTLPDSTIMLCDLDVRPAELNAFLVPVDLALHTSGTDADLDSLQVYWWDEEAAAWVDMGCQKSTSLERIFSAEVGTTEPATGVRLGLDHFSRYATGKAGW